MSSLEAWKAVENSPQYVDADPDVKEAVRAEFQRRHGAIPEEAPIGNALRGAGERVGDIAGNFAKAVEHHPLTKGANAVQDYLYGKFSDTLGKPVFDDGLIPTWYGPQDLKQLRQAGNPDGERASFSGLKRSVADAAEGVDLGYVPTNTNETLKDAWKRRGMLGAAAKTPGFMFEQGLKSIPDMVAAGAAPIPYVASLSQEIAEERARNKSLLGDGSEEPGMADFLASVPFAAGVMALERIVPKMFSKSVSKQQASVIADDIMRGGAANAAATQALKGGATEFTTEALQEGILQYVGERLGTEAEMKVSEAIERGGFAGLAGVGMGASMGGVGGAIEATRKPVEGFESDQSVGQEEDAVFSDQPPMLPGPDPQGRLEGPDPILSLIDGSRGQRSVMVDQYGQASTRDQRDAQGRRLTGPADLARLRGPEQYPRLTGPKQYPGIEGPEQFPALPYDPRGLPNATESQDSIIVGPDGTATTLDQRYPVGPTGLKKVMANHRAKQAEARLKENARLLQDHFDRVKAERQTPGVLRGTVFDLSSGQMAPKPSVNNDANFDSVQSIIDNLKVPAAPAAAGEVMEQKPSQEKAAKPKPKPKTAKTPDLILTTKGTPFKSEGVAAKALKNRGIGNTHEVVPHEGGFAVAKKGSGIAYDDKVGTEFTGKGYEWKDNSTPPDLSEVKGTVDTKFPENTGQVDRKDPAESDQASMPLSAGAAPSIFGDSTATAEESTAIAVTDSAKSAPAPKAPRKKRLKGRPTPENRGIDAEIEEVQKQIGDLTEGLRKNNEKIINGGENMSRARRKAIRRDGDSMAEIRDGLKRDLKDLKAGKEQLEAKPAPKGYSDIHYSTPGQISRINKEGYYYYKRLIDASLSAEKNGTVDSISTERKIKELAGLYPEYESKRQESLSHKSRPAPKSKPSSVFDNSDSDSNKKSGNTIFTDEAAEKARAIIRSKLNNINSGLDPELLQAGITLAGYHIEKGARKFAAYAKAMVEDLGDGVKPYLKSWYMAAKYDPRMSGIEGLDNAQAVEEFDVDSGPEPQWRTDQEKTVYTPNNTPVTVSGLRLVELDDLTISHSIDGSVNPDYPKALQPRDRSRKSYQDQIIRISNDLNPSRLGESSDTSSGSPIVHDGVVESGNGRSLALSRVYETGINKDKYQRWIQGQGFDIEGMNKPVLVRERTQPMTESELVDYTRESNKRDTADMSATENAASDAEIVANNLSLLDSSDITSAANAQFVSRFIGSLSKEEQQSVQTANGHLSQAGRSRIEAAILKLAYGDDKIVSEVFENADSDIKSVGNALLDAAPDWAKMREEENFDITGNVLEAVNVIQKSKSQGVPVSSFVSNADMFSGSLDDQTINVLRAFYKGDSYKSLNSRKKIGDWLKSYANISLNTTPTGGLFNDPVSAKDIIGSLDEKAKSNPTGSLFDAVEDSSTSDQGSGRETQGSKPNQQGESAREENTAGSPALAEKKGTATTKEIQEASTADLLESMRAIGKDFYRGLSNVNKDIVRRLEKGKEVTRDEAVEVVTAHRDYWIRREKEGAEETAKELAHSERLYGSKTIAELEEEYERLGGAVGDLQNTTEIRDGNRSSRDATRNEGARDLGQQRMKLKRYIDHRKENEAKSKESSEEKTSYSADPVEHLLEINRKVINGEMSADEIRQAWAEYKQNKDTVEDQASKFTKKKMLDMSPFLQWRYKNEKKAAVVSAFINNLEMAFVLRDSIQYDPFSQNGRESAIDKMVESYTDDQVKAYSDKIKKAREDRKAENEKVISAIKDPQTYDDFLEFKKIRGEDKLTDEQRQRWEQLQADRELENRAREKEKLKTVASIDGDYEFDLVETKHTKTGDDLFVVVPKSRLGSETFREFADKAKAMGGWYPRGNYRGKIPGFHFRSKESATKFMGLLEGDQDVAAQVEAKESEKVTKKSAKIRALAEKLKASAIQVQNADRKTNTARRARMAGSAIAQAHKDEQFADTLLRIADGIDKGEVKYLAGISNKAQVAEIESRLMYAKYKSDEKSGKDKTYKEREEDRYREPTEGDIKLAEMPYPSLYRDGLQSLANDLYNVHGGKIISRQLSNIAKGLQDKTLFKFRSESDLQLARKAKEKLGKDTAWQISDSLEKYDRLARAGIDSDAMLKSALREYMSYRGGKKTESKAAKLERELIGDRSVGIDFFPTPPAQSDYIVGLADIQPGMDVLEPSAGNGHLADSIGKLGVQADVIELSPTLREILEAKGYRIAGNDFMEFDAEGEYDRIVMNPPFSKRMDAEHVMHAYKMLKPGGRLVSIMGEGVFFGSDKKAVAFREWLDEHDGTSEKLPEKFFMDTNNIKTTGVNSRVVVIDKPMDNDGKFSATAESKPGMLAEEIEGQIDTEMEGLRSKGAKINVVQSHADLPQAAQDHLAKHPHIRARGYYEPSTGTMYLVADNIGGRSEALRVLEHEVIGHWSVEKILGDEFGAFAKRVNMLIKTGVKPVKQMVSRLKDIYGDQFDSLSDEVVASEVIAMLAEQYVDKSPMAKVLSDLFTKVVSAARKVLKAVRFDTGFTMNDVAVMLIRARNNQDLSGTSQAGYVGKFSVVSPPRDQKGQYLDKLFRLPLRMFGTLDEHNRVQLPAGVQRKVNATRAEIKRQYENNFTWAHPIVDSIGHNLLDRFGVRRFEGYIDREKSVPLDARNFLMRGRRFIQKMDELGISDLEQARAFQKIINSEEMPRADWQALSKEIRDDITEMGKEAVELGLITQAQYDRNKASYLHRSYAKYESVLEGRSAAQRRIAAHATNKRRRLQGEELKERGIDNNVSNDRLVEIISGEKPITVDTKDIMKSLKGAVKLNQKLRVVSRAKDNGMVENRYLKETDQVPAGWKDRGVWEVAKFGATTTRLRRQAEIKKGMEFRSAYKKLDNGKIRRKYLAENEATPAGYTDEGVWWVKKVGKENSVIHRDFTKQEREQMGEILDARYNVAKTFQLLGHDLAVGRFYSDIAKNKDWAKAELEEGDEVSEPKGRFSAPVRGTWVKVPQTKIPKSEAYKYGKLAQGAVVDGKQEGMYIRAEIWADLNELEEIQAESLWRDILRVWKKTKTVYNPVTHFNNVIANFTIMDLADVRARDLIAGVKSYFNQDEYYHDADMHGAFGSSMVDHELKKDILEPILKEIKAEIDSASDSPFSRFKLVNKIVSGIKAADTNLTKAYQLEDEVFRMAYFRKLIDQGYDGREAAVLAREQFIDYDIHAPLINELRGGKLALLPFLSFTYRAVPLLLRALRYKPWKFAKYAAIMHGVNAIGYALSGGDEEKERKALASHQQGNTLFGTPRMVRLPFSDHNDDPAFYDARRIFPLSDFFDMQQGSSAVPINAALTPGGPLMLLAEIVLNKRGFTGQEITNREIDTLGEKAMKTGEYLAQQFLPPHLPGGYYFDKIKGAATGETDYIGRDYSVTAAVASSLGLKVSGVNVDEGIRRHMFDARQMHREYRQRLYRAARERQRNMISESTYQKIVARTQRDIQRINEKIQELR